MVGGVEENEGSNSEAEAVKEIVQNTVYDIFSAPHCTGLFRNSVHCTAYGIPLYLSNIVS